MSVQGVFINGRRPKTKKDVKETIKVKPELVSLEGIGIMGTDYEGRITEAPDGTYYFVGPDPRTSRKFYGQLIKKGDKITVK